jgi:hypothetical protein
VIRSWAITNPFWSMHWRAAVAFMGRTPFYVGGGPSQWRAALGWLFKADNFAGVVEKMLAAGAPPPITGPPKETRLDRLTRIAKESARPAPKDPAPCPTPPPPGTSDGSTTTARPSASERTSPP